VGKSIHRPSTAPAPNNPMKHTITYRQRYCTVQIFNWRVNSPTHRRDYV
jgi:hypothetical protein